MSRTFPRIKDYDGLSASTTPANLGCTFCHNDNGHTDRMKPAITHFQGRTSFHPVGFDFRGAGTETNNEYLSTFGSATEYELDCVDCHDLVAQADGRDDPETAEVDESSDGDPATSLGGPADKYPEHGPSVDPLNNPYLLRNVTVANEYDALCRSCHRSDAPQTVKGIPMQLASHADGAVGRPLRESDGTVLRTSDLDMDGVADTMGLAITAQCTICHDTHYSSNRRLFNDGQEEHKTERGMAPDQVVTSGDCTTFCHYAGDEKDGVGSYVVHGHGMPKSTYKYKNGRPDADGNFVTMGYTCLSCHVGIDPAQKPHVDREPKGTQQDRYVKRFNLSGTMQASDTGSALGNPLVGICFSCHQAHGAHEGVNYRVGCQDCHDEHAEGLGSTSNVMMIPGGAKRLGSYVAPASAFADKPGAERIIYDTTRYDVDSEPYEAGDPDALDFFRSSDGDGICDSTECHAGKGYAPLGSWINDAGTTHTGGRQEPGTDCNACHKHTGDSLGGWRAGSASGD